MSLLRGPVAFIDDEINDSLKAAFSIRQEIESAGRPVAAYDSIPDPSHIDNWGSLAFLILDWDLSPGSFGAQGGSTLSQYARTALFDFLSTVMEQIFCPVFIISAENVDDINKQLLESGRFGALSLDTRIAVFGKSVVAADLFGYLEEWVSNNLALSVLKVWEREYDLARNRMFIDFNSLEPNWPSYLWRASLADKVEPSFELASTITANLLQRMDLLSFDSTGVAEYDGPISSESMRKVSSGRTVIGSDRLHNNVVMPGDLFSDVFSNPPDETIWLNITPACHTVLGRLNTGEHMSLYLIPGTPQPMPPSASKFAEWIKSGDGPNKMLVHTLHGEVAYLFDFKKARIADWSDVSKNRLGRLLAPFITRMQQAYSMFLQVEGVPRVTFDLYRPPT